VPGPRRAWKTVATDGANDNGCGIDLAAHALNWRTAMHLAVNTRRLRRGLALLALGVLLAGAALTLSQCKMVDERLTGVSLAKSSPTSCASVCAPAYNDSIRAESALHVTNAQACGSDPVCSAMEELRHEQAVDRIQAGRRKCQEDCHHQGHGNGH
jgi:hypothetical protein